MQNQSQLQRLINIFRYKVSEKSVNEIERLKLLRESIPNSIKSFQTKKLNITLREAINESEEFMKYHFKLHDINYMILSNNNCILNTGITDPYQIPIEKTSNSRSTTEAYFLSVLNDYPRRLYIRIRIQENITEATPSTISHEITHTQQEPQEGIVNYYTNVEVLPILLGTLHYKEKLSQNENQRRAILKRIQSLEKDINCLEVLLNTKKITNLVATSNYDNNSLDEDIISCSTYIESTIKALNLFDLYLNSNDKIKKEIFNFIQNIFDGNRSVEEFLEYYDTTFESSISSLQKVLKNSIF